MGGGGPVVRMGMGDWRGQDFLALSHLSWHLLFTKLPWHRILCCGNLPCLALLKLRAAREGLPRWWW